MRIGIISDIHDNLDNLERVLTALQTERPDCLLCLGDVTTPETLDVVLKALPGIPLHAVAGNMDNANEIKSFIDTKGAMGYHYHHLTGTLSLDSKRIAFTHKPRDAEVLLQEDFDIICYGHTHEPRLLTKEDTLLVNPGDIQGRFGESPGYAVYDTSSGEAELKKV